MIPIKYYTVIGQDGDKILSADIPIENGDTLVTFLIADVGAAYTDILAMIDNVMRGESAIEEGGGNICYLEVRAELSKIYDNMAAEEERKSTCCEVRTEELRDLIVEWCDVSRKFYKGL